MEKQILDSQVDLSAYDTAAAAAQKVSAAVEAGNEETLAAAKSYADTQAAAALQGAKEYTAEEIGKLNYIKFVDSLPQTGESKYIYAVVQDERTPDDEAIVLLFVWTGTEFAAVGVMAGAVDASVFQPYVDAAQAAQTGAETAQTAAESARDAAQSAQTAAEAAQGAAESAQTAAETAKGQAENFASSAQSAATAAQTSADSADTFAQAASSSQQAAAGSATAASTSADLAQDWAVKMDGAVADGEYSAKYHAQQAADSAASVVGDAESAAASATAAAGSASAAAQSAQEAADSAESINPDNLANKGLENTGRLTNCITKIPQDINLVLSEGTLTLKAGSKAYDGAGNAVPITSDKTTTVSYNGKHFALLTSSGATLTTIGISSCTSGETDSLAGQQYHLWYDTANKVVNYYGQDGSAVSNTRTLPIALITVSGSKITSIDQVFNGFGYIGNTMFALPGVSGLIPNGRNADGTLNNTAVTVSALRTLSFSNQTQSDFGLTATIIFSSVNAVYNTVDNKNYNPITGDMLGFCNCGTVETDSTGVITSLNPKTAFHALDYNDTSHVSAQGKPSEKSKDLTLSSSGVKYTAPANGWFYLEKTANSGEYIEIKDGVGGASQYAAADGQGLKLLYPAKVGKIVTISYTASGTTGAFRFIYDEGAK